MSTSEKESGNETGNVETGRATRCCVRRRTELGEGPLWDDHTGVLWWVDITGGTLFRYNPRTGENDSFDVGRVVGTVALRESGGLLLALRDGLAAFDPAMPVPNFLAKLEAGQLERRANDGACDPAGRFWIGTMTFAGDDGAGVLYRFDPDTDDYGYACERVFEGLTIPNGLCWSDCLRLRPGNRHGH